MVILRTPAVPLVTAIPGGPLNDGDSVIIQGEPLANCKRFSVNLTDQSGSDCAFHVGLRFDQNTMVRNSKVGPSWGQEEPSPLPFENGKAFQLEICATEYEYLLYINGDHHSDFKYRAPHSAASTLQIIGDIRITSVEFLSLPSAPVEVIHRLKAVNPVVPFVKPFGGPLDVGGQIEIKGKVKPNAQRFSINLQQGTKTDGSQVIALHLNPRFKGAQGIVVMNTKSGKWAEEERIDSTKNPFRPDGKFTLTVRRQADCFEILVNGVELKKFKHRVNANMADAVAIEGDVILESVLLS